jgi:hypothetical protein
MDGWREGGSRPVVMLTHGPDWLQGQVAHRGTSLTRKHTPLGPYRRPMPMVLNGS